MAAEDSHSTGGSDDVEPPRTPPSLVTAGVAVLIVAAVAYVRIGLEHKTILPIAYGMPLLVALWSRHRGFLWVLVGAFTAISFIHYAQLKSDTITLTGSRWVAFALVEVDMLVTAGVFDVLIATRAALERDRKST